MPGLAFAELAMMVGLTSVAGLSQEEWVSANGNTVRQGHVQGTFDDNYGIAKRQYMPGKTAPCFLAPLVQP
jgi:hypothetical protein